MIKVVSCGERVAVGGATGASVNPVVAVALLDLLFALLALQCFSPREILLLIVAVAPNLLMAATVPRNVQCAMTIPFG
jgi:hypothetical protein